MNVSRLLDQPYLDLTGIHKTWVKNHQYSSPTYWLYVTLNLVTSKDSTIPAFPVNEGWVDSNESLLEFLSSKMEETERLILVEIFKMTRRSEKPIKDLFPKTEEFQKLSLQEKCTLLGLHNYPKDRKLNRLCQVLFDLANQP